MFFPDQTHLMAFRIERDSCFLEQRLNDIANYLNVTYPSTLAERFEILTNDLSPNSTIKTKRKCTCIPHEKPPFKTLQLEWNSLCLSPVIAFIQGTDIIQDWMIDKVKRSIFESESYPNCNKSLDGIEQCENLCFRKFTKKFMVTINYLYSHRNNSFFCYRQISEFICPVTDTKADAKQYYSFTTLRIKRIFLPFIST